MTRETYLEYKDLIEAWANGAEIEFYNDSKGVWEYVENPGWIEYIKYRIKPEKYELKGGEWFVSTDYGFCVKQEFSTDCYRESGLERTTKEQAENLSKHLKRVARLHALACELGGLKEFVPDEENYFVFNDKGEWKRSESYSYYYPEVVCMTRECAEKVCEMLNNGEFKLEE